jgi:hypothetical protein
MRNLPWEWLVIDRERTLDPIENWYSAIGAVARENEVVFLHGDDDLFTPWGLIERYERLTASESDMLLSRSSYGLIFLAQRDDLVHLPEDAVPVWKPDPAVEQLELAELTDWGPAFLGNHTYRYSSGFRNALRKGFEWCNDQDWLDRNTRTLMLPYYLPFAIKLVGGSVIGYDQVCVIRGCGIEERLVSPFGVAGWNPGFLALCAYGVLNNSELCNNSELNRARREMLEMTISWFFTFYVDRRIPSRMRSETCYRIRIPRGAFLTRGLLQGIRRIVFQWFGLTGKRVQWRATRNHQRLSEVLGMLSGLRAREGVSS